MNKDLVFIASGGRTGTQFFGYRLKDIIEDCWSEHEPDMIHGFSPLTLNRIRRFGVWHMVLGRILGKSGIRVIGRQYLAGKLSDEQLYKKIRKMRKKYHDEQSAHLIIESYAIWWMLAPQIENIWPDAKVLGVVRDPRTWIESWLKHEPDRRNGFWKESVLSSNVTPALIGDDYWAARWKNMGQVAKLAWEWKTIYERIHEGAFDSQSVRIFRFEDIFSNKEILREVLDFVTEHKGRTYRINEAALRDFTNSRLNSSKGESLSWMHWSVEDARIVDEICGPLMKIFDYGNEAEWLEKINSNKSY